jgi:hypothetical protein
VYYNLFLAVFWLVLGASLFIWRWLSPDATQFRFEPFGVSAGWVALLLAVYNLLRWTFYYAARTRSPQLSSTRLPPRRSTPTSSLREPDPAFDFTSGSPEPDEDSKNQHAG